MFCRNCGQFIDPSAKFCTKCGTPTGLAPTPSPSHQFPSPQLSGPAGYQPKRKTPWGKILLIIGGVLVLLAGGIAAAVYVGFRQVEKQLKSVEKQLKSSEAYRMAEATLRQSKAASAAFGEIKELGFPLGSFNMQSGGTGDAKFTMSVTGTKTSGRYFVDMTREHGKWRIEKGIVKLDNGQVINVVDSAQEESDDQAQDESETEATGNADQINKGHGAIRGGVLNSKATSLPDPAYPEVAKTARATGTVTVQVVIDEKGKVISARAVSGHPLLRQAAVDAARQARFSPTKLSGTPVKVSGVITYNFERP